MLSQMPPGSSPLARGLRWGVQRELPIERIIPARAGFTSTSRTRSHGGTDHPRSRGVYRSSRSRSRGSPGSSPLARGLPITRKVTEKPPRIIPARAGFTCSRRDLGSSPRDHPRSRGVYRFGKPRPPAILGSSPLARGLRRLLLRRLDGARIIPARAGFTRSTTGRCGAPSDHPRSRGVYGERCSCRVPSRGSSPLARGLRTRPRARR